MMGHNHTVNKVNPYSLSCFPAHFDLGVAVVVFLPGLPRSLNLNYKISQQNSEDVCLFPICVSVYHQFINDLKSEKIIHFLRSHS